MARQPKNQPTEKVETPAETEAPAEAEAAETKQPEFNFDTLVPEEATSPIKREVKAKPNPMARLYNESAANEDKALQITIPNAAVKKAVNGLRRASTDAGRGVRVQTHDNGNETTTVVFAAKPRRKSKKGQDS